MDLDANLSLMDFRLYDGALGRFAGIDMLADMFTSHSPYHFAYNNPVSFMDPTGLHIDPAKPNQESGTTDWGTDWEFEDGDDGLPVLVIDINRKYWRPSQEDRPGGYTMNVMVISHDYGGSGGGSVGGRNDNINPRGASNEIFGFTIAEIGTLSTVRSVFASGLEGRAQDNANYKYKYGSKTHTAQQLTDLNKARMNSIAKGANALSRAVGVTGAAIAVYDAFENPTTANVIKASVNVGLLFVRMNPVTGIILGISDLSGFSDYIYNGVGNMIDNY